MRRHIQAPLSWPKATFLHYDFFVEYRNHCHSDICPISKVNDTHDMISTPQSIFMCALLVFHKFDSPKWNARLDMCGCHSPQSCSICRHQRCVALSALLTVAVQDGGWAFPLTEARLDSLPLYSWPPGQRSFKTQLWHLHGTESPVDPDSCVLSLLMMDCQSSESHASLSMLPALCFETVELTANVWAAPLSSLKSTHPVHNPYFTFF